MLPPVEMSIPKHTHASSLEPTGELTRFEEEAETEQKGWAARGKLPQSRGSGSLGREVCQSSSELRMPGESRKLPERRKAVQMERASLPWSCSNPERDARATSRASNGSTASPVPTSPARRSQRHTPRARQRARLEKLA